MRWNRRLAPADPPLHSGEQLPPVRGLFRFRHLTWLPASPKLAIRFYYENRRL